MNNRKVVVVDLDGTLADVRHRIDLVRSDTPDWEAFYARLEDDSVNEWCKELMGCLWMQGHRVIIVSARPQRCLVATRRWLRSNDVTHSQVVLLRGSHGDFTPDQELKRKWLHEFGKDRILFVVDDRQKVVDMWRSEGVTCLQCNTWPEFKRNKK